MKKNFSLQNIYSAIVVSFLMLMSAASLAPALVHADPPDNNGGTTSSGDCGEFEQAGPLCLPKNPINGGNNSLVGQTTATGLIAMIVKYMLYFAGIIAVVFVIIGGYYYITARGNEEQATKGRQTLVYALIGVAIVILSYVIVSALTKQLTSNI